MPNVRRIWHLQPQSALYQKTLNSSIANFFAIQCNSIELHCSSTVKKIYIYFMMPFSPEISLSSPSFVSVLFSLFILYFSICSLSSLQTQTTSSSQHQHQHHTPSSITETSPSLSPISITKASHGLSLISHRIVAQPIHPDPSPSLKLHTASLSSLTVTQPIHPHLSPNPFADLLIS